MASSEQALWLHLLLAFWLNYFVSCGQCTNRINVALNKPTTQSSTRGIQDGTGEAGKAVDGVTSGGRVCQSCSSTKSEACPWWMVDLGAEFQVAEVVISNRNTDNAALRLRNFSIEVATSIKEDQSLENPVFCARRYDSQPSSSTVSYPCLHGTIPGRYVRITLQDGGYLMLCEVQVFEPDDDGDGRKSGLDCSGTFALYGTDVMPSDQPIYSTSFLSPMLCGSLCLTMGKCFSFTVNSTNQKLWECRLYECKMSRLDTVYGSRYFV